MTLLKAVSEIGKKLNFRGVKTYKVKLMAVRQQPHDYVVKGLNPRQAINEAKVCARQDEVGKLLANDKHGVELIPEKNINVELTPNELVVISNIMGGLINDDEVLNDMFNHECYPNVKTEKVDMMKELIEGILLKLA